MSNLEKLIQKATAQQCRLQIRFDPFEEEENWGIKYYPDADDDAHFYAYHFDLDCAARQLLDESKGLETW